jgi:hypothetical protein
MAYYSGSFASTAAGSWITLFDAYLPLNANWSIFDGSAGTNEKTYQCLDYAENVEFYVNIQDNQTSYCLVELWEGWDVSTHAGVGQSVAVYSLTYTCRFYRPVGGWGLAVHDHHFRIWNYNRCGYYCGAPRRYDESLNLVMIVADSTTTSNQTNQTANVNNGNMGGWRFLFDSSGGTSLGNFASAGGSGTIVEQFKAHDGTFRGLMETEIRDITADLVIGQLEGYISFGNRANGLAAGDTVTIDGETWKALDGISATKYWSLFRQA